jgi:hypothetical protein
LSPYQKTLRWNKIKISYSLRPSPDIPVALSEEIGRQVFAHARLIPLEIARASASLEDVDVKIHLWVVVGTVAPNGATPVVAWINGLGSSGEMATSDTGRLVYGEIRGSTYTTLWDSPLFNSNGQIYFKDMNRDRWLEIVIKSSEYCVNHCPEEIVIFDKGGRELTRQKECATSPYPYDQEDGVCAIRGQQIDVNDAILLSNGDPGPAEIDVSGWDGDGKNLVFKLVNGTYVPGPPLIPTRRK